jgi:hypothetical protein
MIRLLLSLPVLAAAATGATAQTMDHAQHGAHQMQANAAALPRETGQSAFAAIQEIVAMLSADPATDWSKVDIDALRNHLVDMDELTRNASAQGTKTENGLTIRVTGKGRTLRAIQAMVPAHAAELDRIAGWSVQAAITDDGATMTVAGDGPAEVRKIQALGFFGLMATGAHHQEHHWAMATGGMVHAH